MLYKITFCFLFTIVSSHLSSQSKIPFFATGQNPLAQGSTWIAVEGLSDDFESDTVDTQKWQIEPYANDWVWIGRAPGLFKAENVQTKDGNLCVTVGKLDKPVQRNGKTYTHQGGIVRSLKPGKVGMYFEAKMKANATEMSSTFWLMSKYDCEKKLETDIQECVGVVSPNAEKWSKGWDSIFHSNAIHRQTPCNDKLQLQNATKLNVPNHARYFVYGCWWKSPSELLFFLDGKYQYTIHPKVEWDQPAYLHMAIETYSWNPLPEDGGRVENGTWDQRTTKYDWVRTWQVK